MRFGVNKPLLLLADTSGTGAHAGQARRVSALSISREENVQDRWSEGKATAWLWALAFLPCFSRAGRALGSVVVVHAGPGERAGAAEMLNVCWLWPWSPWGQWLLSWKNLTLQMQGWRLDLSPPGKSYDMRSQGCTVWLSVGLAWHKFLAEMSGGVSLTEALSLLTHKESLWLNIGGGANLMCIFCTTLTQGLDLNRICQGKVLNCFS